MDYPMRRKDRQLAAEQAVQILQENQYGVLSTVGPDGMPYGVPLSYVYEDGCLYFHCAKEGRKLDSLRSCGRASFCVVGRTKLLPAQFSTQYESAIAEGPIRELDEEEKEAALSRLVEKYSPDFREKGAAFIRSQKGGTCVLCLEIKTLAGKARR